MPAGPNNLPEAGEPVAGQTTVKVSLKCPITGKRMSQPARGQECRHPQVTSK